MQPPGWMLDRGWSVTAEVRGVTATDHLGPHVTPVVAWAMHRAEETRLVVGGRHLGAPGSPRTTLLVKVNGNAVGSWPILPGFFVRQLALGPGTLAGAAGYTPIEVDASAEPHVPVSLEQFDVQGPGVPMFAYEEGWQERSDRSLGFA